MRYCDALSADEGAVDRLEAALGVLRDPTADLGLLSEEEADPAEVVAVSGPVAVTSRTDLQCGILLHQRNHLLQFLIQ